MHRKEIKIYHQLLQFQDEYILLDTCFISNYGLQRYIKYLYPYECVKQKLSSPEEFQAAIVGYRLEDLRSNYGEYGNMLSAARGFHDTSPPVSLVARPLSHFHMNGNGAHGSSSGEDDSAPCTPTHHMPLREALNLAAAEAMEQASRRYLFAPLPPLPPVQVQMYEQERIQAHSGLPSAHIKVTSRGDRRSQIDNSLVVSMNINGSMYQGILFAEPMS